jgi:4-hydroxy-tetrahydrodipicolinate synthase
MKKFKGTGVALITPFKSDSSVDFAALGRVVNHVINGDVNYIVALGTTGESVTLTQDEKNAVMSYVAEIIDGRIPLVVGFGGNNTQEVINAIKRADLEKVDAILSVAPYYNKPSQKGLIMHFSTIATCSPVPVILYNVPGRTSCNMSADTIIELAHECDNIVAIKESSGDINQIMKIIKGTPDNFSVISGDDIMTLPVIAVGGIGVISVMANAFPTVCSDIVNHALKYNFKSARELQFRFLEVLELLFLEGSPAGIKAFMSILNICNNTVRLPLTTVSRTTYSRIQKVVEEVII